MRIGYCSPFNPLKSGISDFSEELVPAIKKQNVEIVIFSPEKLDSQDILSNFEVHKLSRLHNKKLRDSLDLIVYHIGNNCRCHEEIVEMLSLYPGVAELHEIGLHHLVAESVLNKKGAEAYLEYVEYCHGKRGLAVAKRFLEKGGKGPWEQYPLELNMARRIIESSCGVIVHSEMAKQMALGICEAKPITSIPLHTVELSEDFYSNGRAAREKLCIPEGKLVMGSFGFATPTKRIAETISALARYKREKDESFIYYIVGDVAESLDLENIIKANDLSDNVKVTGFVTLDDFKLYMQACDLCFNLRYPTQGESSASIQRMLGMGKPVITTDIGTFAEYPDEIVFKVRADENEVNDIYEALCKLTKSQKVLQSYGEKAFAYAKENFDIEMNAKKYADFFTDMVNGTWQPEYQDAVIGRLCELGLTDEDYLGHLPYTELGLF